MPMIGVRELREHTAEVMRQVREEKTEYVITYQGRPVAFLLPINTEAVESAVIETVRRGISDNWENYAQLLEQIRAQWPPAQDTQDLIDEIRG